jgi:hypothetical protein
MGFLFFLISQRTQEVSNFKRFCNINLENEIRCLLLKDGKFMIFEQKSRFENFFLVPRFDVVEIKEIPSNKQFESSNLKINEFKYLALSCIDKTVHSGFEEIEVISEFQFELYRDSFVFKCSFNSIFY